MTTPTLIIDVVSDISCPWCAVGWSALETALKEVGPSLQVTVRFQPFELNPHMGPGGQDITEHLTEKYGSTPAQQAQIRDTIRERGAAVGFPFHPEGRGRIYNTFNAHRLLHWAGEQGPAEQLALKKALLLACHRDQQAMDESAVLVAAAVAAGLDADRVAEVLATDAYAQEVRDQQSVYLQAGIRSVPAVVFNERHLLSGAQPVSVYEQVIRELAAAD